MASLLNKLFTGNKHANAGETDDRADLPGEGQHINSHLDQNDPSFHDASHRLGGARDDTGGSKLIGEGTAQDGLGGTNLTSNFGQAQTGQFGGATGNEQSRGYGTGRLGGNNAAAGPGSDDIGGGPTSDLSSNYGQGQSGGQSGQVDQYAQGQTGQVDQYAQGQTGQTDQYTSDSYDSGAGLGAGTGAGTGTGGNVGGGIGTLRSARASDEDAQTQDYSSGGNASAPFDSHPDQPGGIVGRHSIGQSQTTQSSATYGSTGTGGGYQSGQTGGDYQSGGQYQSGGGDYQTGQTGLSQGQSQGLGQSGNYGSSGDYADQSSGNYGSSGLSGGRGGDAQTQSYSSGGNASAPFDSAPNAAVGGGITGSTGRHHAQGQQQGINADGADVEGIRQGDPQATATGGAGGFDGAGEGYNDRAMGADMGNYYKGQQPGY